VNAKVVIVVDPELETPPYVQIEEQVRAYIERAELGPGAALPTVRQLARDLGVAPNTIARAYALLQGEGWLVSDGRRGTRVAEHVPSHDKRLRAASLRETVDRFVSSLVHRGFSAGEIAVELQRHTR
jgi:DNA-binding transcriptional regulator YhcF (GntR family)